MFRSIRRNIKRALRALSEPDPNFILPPPPRDPWDDGDDNSFRYREPRVDEHVVEELPPEWDDALEDYDDGAQLVDWRPSQFDRRPLHLVVPNFGEGNSDLYRAFADS